MRDTAEPEDVVIVGNHFVLDTSADAEILYYAQSAPWVLTPPVLTIEGRIKLVSSASSTNVRSAASLGFTIGSAHHKNILFLEPTGVFLLGGDGTRGPAATTATTDAFHTYRLEVDTKTGVVAVFRDGQSILNGPSFKDPDVTENRVFWGESSVLARGRSEWEYVEHNAANLANCR